MSRKKTNQRTRMAATGAGRRARRVAAQVKPAAAQIKPLAQSAAAAATRRVRTTRAWAAPQVERTGLVVQHNVAPKVSAWLSVAARRLEPAGHGVRAGASWPASRCSPLPLARQRLLPATAPSRTR